MVILQHEQIVFKIRRMAAEIIERHADEPYIILAGINNNGFRLAGLIQAELTSIHHLPVKIGRIRLNPAAPLEDKASLDLENKEISNKVIIIIDDVANTGRTIFFAFQPLFQSLPKRLEVAVLIDRLHKSFPVHVDYMGLRLATTTKDNILVDIQNNGAFLASMQ